MLKAGIVSLKFSPGHVAHLNAFYNLFKELGLATTLYLDKNYESFFKSKENTVYLDSIAEIVTNQPDFILIYNIGLDNIKLVKQCKKNNIKTAYVLHEPRGSINELMAEGKDILKTLGAWVLNTMICKNCDKVLLASATGVKNYERYMRNSNINYGFFPLIFCDEYDPMLIIERKYFSFIGNFSEVHGCKEFIRLIEDCTNKNSEISFLIATRYDITSYLENSTLRKAIESGQLTVHMGKPMTTEEINKYYRESICVWNVYNRSTQSGVLPNAFMQGTPALVNNNGAAKDVFVDGTAGVFVSMPPNTQELEDSFLLIKKSLHKMSSNARSVFKQQYYYKSFYKLAQKEIVSIVRG